MKSERASRCFLPIIGTALIAAAVIVLGLTLPGDPLGLTGIKSRFFSRRAFEVNEDTKSHIFKHAAVAADSGLCSNVGVGILKKGGNAVDAAIATMLCTGVVNCHSAGIGGGGFMLIYEKKQRNGAKFYVYQQQKGLYALKHFAKLNGESLGIGIPGELRGLELASKKFGKLAWKDLFKPVIKIAKEGFFIHKALYKAITRENMTILDNKGLRELFYNETSKTFLHQGDILKRLKLAKTLTTISKQGADAFYNGSLTATILEDINSLGGQVKLEDFQGYRAISREVIKTDLNGFTALAFPPPTGGVILAETLKLLSGYHLTPQDLVERPVLTFHRIIEAFKFSHAKEALLGDPDFNPKSAEVVKSMLDSTQINKAFNSVSMNTTHPIAYYGYVDIKRDHTSGTTHLSVIDKDGNAVSLTSSINKYFGSKIRSSKLGIIYNDQLQDTLNYWNLQGSKPEYVQPGKRPYSSASPTIMLDKQGNVVMAIGAAGGDFIPTALTMTIMNYLWFNMSLTDAINQPRLHSQLYPDLVITEETFKPEYAKALSIMGHNITTNTTWLTGSPYDIMGVVQVVARKGDKLYAECDVRKGGVPAGY